MTELANIISDVVASPLGEVIAAVGQGVADAQQALDEGSLAKPGNLLRRRQPNAADAAGHRLQPHLYTLPETTGEVRIALRLGSNQTAAPSSTPQINASLARQGLNLPALTNKLYATPWTQATPTALVIRQTSAPNLPLKSSGSRAQWRR